MINEADAVIVGAGITGCSAALALARRGLKVCVFERGVIASEQSSRAWGFIRQQGRHEAEIPLAAEANGLWIELTKRYGFEATNFTQGGILVPAESEADLEQVEDAHRTASCFGVQTKLLNRDDLRDLLPQMAGSWRGGLFTPGDAHGEPGLSTRSIARAAVEEGVRIFEHTPVLSLERQGGKITGIHTAQGVWRAPVVVVANGIGASALARTAGITLPIQVIKSSVSRTVKTKPFTQIAMWSPHVAYRPNADGSFTIGNGYRGLGPDYEITLESLRGLRHFLPAYRKNWRLLKLSLGRDFIYHLKIHLGLSEEAEQLPEPSLNQSKIERNAERFRALFPHLGNIQLDSRWAGRLDLTPDAIPIIDRPVGHDGLLLAAGFSGHGFALGPSIGKQISEWICDGKPSLDLSPFRLARFQEGSVARAQKAL